MNPAIEILASDSAVFGWAPLAAASDRVDLIHRFGAERIEFGLHQVPHRVAVRRDEDLGGLLEFVEMQQLCRDVEPGHRRVGPRRASATTGTSLTR